MRVFGEMYICDSQSSLTPVRNGWILNKDTLDDWFDGNYLPQLVFDNVVHEKNKYNNLGNITAGNYK